MEASSSNTFNSKKYRKIYEQKLYDNADGTVFKRVRDPVQPYAGDGQWT
jgi:hypothetical protein